MKNPLVSIIVCTKDRANILEEYALKSLLKQSYKNFEIIVIDDNSKDDTLQMLEKYKDKIKVIKNKKNKGLCYVRNLGIKNSNGEIFAFIDDDCIADKDWLKELVKSYRGKKVMVVGGKIYIDKTNKTLNKQKEIYAGNISFRSEIFKRFLFDKNLYFNKCSLHDEKEFLYRLRDKGIKIIYNNKAIVRHFKMPAKYRKNVEFGEPMNNVYMHTKTADLFFYYFFLLIPVRRMKDKDYRKYNLLRDSINKAKGLLSSKNLTFFKVLWIFYILFFIIPVKAKLQNAKEEKILKS